MVVPLRSPVGLGPVFRFLWEQCSTAIPAAQKLPVKTVCVLKLANLAPLGKLYFSQNCTFLKNPFRALPVIVHLA